MWFFTWIQSFILELWNIDNIINLSIVLLNVCNLFVNLNILLISCVCLLVKLISPFCMYIFLRETCFIDERNCNNFSRSVTMTFMSHYMYTCCFRRLKRNGREDYKRKFPARRLQVYSFISVHEGFVWLREHSSSSDNLFSDIMCPVSEWYTI